jgi:hypothetical protein
VRVLLSDLVVPSHFHLPDALAALTEKAHGHSHADVERHRHDRQLPLISMVTVDEGDVEAAKSNLSAKVACECASNLRLTQDLTNENSTYLPVTPKSLPSWYPSRIDRPPILSLV